MDFEKCDLRDLAAIIGIVGIEIALIITGNDGAYALPLVGAICLIIGIKLPEDKAKDFILGLFKKGL